MIEEKKVIVEIDISKTIESNIDYWRNKCFEQQKEIEDLKEDLSKKVKALDIAMSNPDYICKDRIREKIKELEEIGQMLTAEQGYWGNPKLLNQMEILKELLEE